MCRSNNHAETVMMRPENINSPETKNGQKNPAETTGVRYKNVNLISRKQQWRGSVGCLGQIENIKRQSLKYSFNARISR